MPALAGEERLGDEHRQRHPRTGERERGGRATVRRHRGGTDPVSHGLAALGGAVGEDAQPAHFVDEVAVLPVPGAGVGHQRIEAGDVNGARRSEPAGHGERHEGTSGDRTGADLSGRSPKGLECDRLAAREHRRERDPRPEGGAQGGDGQRSAGPFDPGDAAFVGGGRDQAGDAERDHGHGRGPGQDNRVPARGLHDAVLPAERRPQVAIRGADLREREEPPSRQGERDLWAGRPGGPARPSSWRRGGLAALPSPSSDAK